MYEHYPSEVAEEIVRLRRRIIQAKVPPKHVDRNLLIATWNIRAFGEVFHDFVENPDSPKRNLRGLAHIAEIVRRFDIVALQEVRDSLEGVRLLLDWLGPDWGLITSDVTRGRAGNHERLSFVYDRRRVEASGLAAELVLPLEAAHQQGQFARTPYAVSFRAAQEEFVLVTLHILYGHRSTDREPELRAIAKWMADWGGDDDRYHEDLIVLGDFNIDRVGDPRFEAFTSAGLTVPPALRGIRANVLGAQAKHYDQIGWFMGQLRMSFTGVAGTVDFSDAVFRELSRSQMTWRVSDHLPLWVEFRTDRSESALGETLNVDPEAPEGFGIIPD